jgi:hypothetical protein
MSEKPLYMRIYFDECYATVCRRVGYRGFLVRDLYAMIEELAKQFGKNRVPSAAYNLVTFEGQLTVHPSSLAKVELRAHVKKLCWQLLGPPPEQREAFYKDTQQAEAPKEEPEKPKRKRKT